MPTPFAQDLYCPGCRQIYRVPRPQIQVVVLIVACPNCGSETQVRPLPSGKLETAPMPGKAAASAMVPNPISGAHTIVPKAGVFVAFAVAALLGLSAYAMVVQPWLCPLAFFSILFLSYLYVVAVLASDDKLEKKSVASLLDRAIRVMPYALGKRPREAIVRPE